ncbi:MAG TPA: hypothetical protein VMR66_10365 [Gemmatimonadota bacterium]|nr:hypothetical protein [Gemmatimonadota bacterium]
MKRAAFALALALLVPARAAALCCLDASAREGPAAAEHGRAHHAEAPAVAEGRALTAADAGPECELAEASAPALRERGPADETRSPCVSPIAPGGSLPTADSVARAPLPAALLPPPGEIRYALRL